MLKRVAAAYPSVRYLPLSPALCVDGLCRTSTDDGYPLYVDDDHVSRTAAVTVLRDRFDMIWAADAAGD